MLCPRCQIDFNAVHWGECPHCGDPNVSDSNVGEQKVEVRGALLEGIMKTSTILISTDDGGVFRSLDEVPEPLRTTLAASTSGANSATIVIADKGGRDRIAAALRNLPPQQEMPSPVHALPDVVSRWHRPGVVWLGLLAAGCTGGVAWYLYTRGM